MAYPICFSIKYSYCWLFLLIGQDFNQGNKLNKSFFLFGKRMFRVTYKCLFGSFYWEGFKRGMSLVTVFVWKLLGCSQSCLFTLPGTRRITFSPLLYLLYWCHGFRIISQIGYEYASRCLVSLLQITYYALERPCKTRL